MIRTALAEKKKRVWQETHDRVREDVYQDVYELNLRDPGGTGGP